jgi:hypothetical protein
MKCRRSEELWSDYLEGTLPGPLVKDLEAHLAACEECPPLLDAFREVVSNLQALPRLEPSPELVERVLAATRGRLRGPEQPRSNVLPGLPLPAWSQWVAWAAAAALVTLLLVRPGSVLSGIGDRLSRFGHRAYSYGLQVYRGSEQLLDELNVLRMTVGVAFEDRLDRLNERLKDLEEARRRSEGPSEEESRLTAPLDVTDIAIRHSLPQSRSLS